MISAIFSECGRNVTLGLVITKIVSRNGIKRYSVNK